MKDIIIFLTCFIYSLALKTTQMEEPLSAGTTIILESGDMVHFYLAANGTACANATDSMCGFLYGNNITYTGSTVDLSRRRDLQWYVMKQDDFYCLRSVEFNAFLFMDGRSCRSQGTARTCGTPTLYKSSVQNCTDIYGWRVNMVQNYYILQSVLHPDVYLFLNGDGCEQGNIVQVVAPTPPVRRGTRNVAPPAPPMPVNRCGSVSGLYARDMMEVYSNDEFKWIFFNIPFKRRYI
jgi:hypothetical protein